MIPILHNFFQKLDAERTLLNSFYEARITLIAKPDEDIERKVKYKPISLMNQISQKKCIIKINLTKYKNNYMP